MNKAAVIVVFRDGKFLATSRRNSTTQWGLPGGKVDAGELVEDAAVRELKEETGLIVNVNDLLPFYCDQVDGFIATAFLCKKNFFEMSGELKAEPGINLAWKDMQTLCDDSSSPFAEYNRGVFEVLKEVL